MSATTSNPGIDRNGLFRGAYAFCDDVEEDTISHAKAFSKYTVISIMASSASDCSTVK